MSTPEEMTPRELMLSCADSAAELAQRWEAKGRPDKAAKSRARRAEIFAELARWDAMDAAQTDPRRSPNPGIESVRQYALGVAQRAREGRQ